MYSRFSTIFLVAQLIAFFGFAPTVEAKDPLDRFNTPQTSLLDDIALAPDRDYLVYLHIPPKARVDLRNAETVRLTVILPFLKDASASETGHTALGWQCNGRRGVISYAADFASEARRAALNGWGGTSILATYENGVITDKNALLDFNVKELRAGNGIVFAAEVTPKACQNALAYIRAFLTSPKKPEKIYGFFADPAKFEGATCMSLLMEIGKRANLWGDVHASLYRRFDLHESAFGWRSKIQDRLRPPYHLFKGNPKPRRISIFTMLKGPLDQGPIVASARLIDVQLMFAAFAGAASMSGLPIAKLQKRLPFKDDMATAFAFERGRVWTKRFKHIRLNPNKKLPAFILEN